MANPVGRMGPKAKLSLPLRAIPQQQAPLEKRIGLVKIMSVSFAGIQKLLNKPIVFLFGQWHV